jgi:holliday junction DNA helicase RuvA
LLDSINRNNITIDVNGVGYLISIPVSGLSNLPKCGQKVKLYTIQVVRENSLALYGFISKDERNLFSMLTSVSGFGPKGALSLIGSFPFDKLVAAITAGNAALISTIPGIGLKTAQKIVVELKEKIAKNYGIKAKQEESIPGDSTYISEAISALITLGYTPREAREAITESKINLNEVKDVEELIKAALKSIA